MNTSEWRLVIMNKVSFCSGKQITTSFSFSSKLHLFKLIENLISWGVILGISSLSQSFCGPYIPHTFKNKVFNGAFIHWMWRKLPRYRWDKSIKNESSFLKILRSKDYDQLQISWSIVNLDFFYLSWTSLVIIYILNVGKGFRHPFPDCS